MGTNNDPWQNIEYEKRNEIKEKILNKVSEESWEDGKGKSLAERTRMYREAIQAAAVQMDFDIEKVMRGVDNDLEEVKKAIKSDIKRWQEEGLPGRGWPGKNYWDERDMLSANDRVIFASISGNMQDYKNIKQLYWVYGVRASLNIDASKLEDSIYERMHGYLSELEAAENELRQGVKQMCLFRYSVEGIRRLGDESSISAARIFPALALSWLGPAREKYNAVREATEEAYKRISLEEGLPDNVDPL